MGWLRRFAIPCSIAWYWLAAQQIPAPPALEPGGIVNSASRLPATLRGGAIAPGARFVIPGVRLGPSTPVHGSESDPPASLSGVSVRMQSARGAVDAGLFLVSAQRIEAWAPASTPLGEIQLTVSYEGRTSEPYTLTIAPAAAGLYPASNAPATLRIPKDISASPGETISLWATGVNGPSLELFVGGKAAASVHVIREPACCKGVEEIRFEVPSGAPPGCSVPVQVRTTDNRPSNVIPIAIHPPGAPCHDAVDWFRETVEDAGSAGFIVLARVSIDVQLAPRSGSQFAFDYGIASFGRQETGQRPLPPLPPMGTCTLFASRLNLRQVMGQARSPSEWTSVPEKISGNRRLDAGGVISIAGPGGIRTLVRDPRKPEYYNAILGGAAPFAREPAKPLYLRSGAYTLSAPGGADISAFSAKLNVSRVITWTNRSKIAEVSRDSGVTLEWRPAEANDVILIVAANADRFSGDSATCLCAAPARDGKFTIPPVSLGNLPETSEESDLSASYLVLVEMPMEALSRIAARGLDAAFAAFVSASARPVKYK